MSIFIVRMCDCPECHGYDEIYGVIDVGDPYEVIGGRDICEPCLSGRFGCTYWQVRVLPQLSQLDLMVQDIWSPVIYAQLQAGMLLRDWDKYTQNRIEFITTKGEGDGQG